MTSLRRGVRLGLALLGAGTMFAAAPGSAQTGTATGAFTESPNAALSRNLRSLAANPKSVTALMGAGKAALDLGDAQAALTFFARAEEQMPRDGRVKMWIASALTQLQQPHAALKFFRDATELGVPAAEIARDRGLAHDIAGNPREAQRDYRIALQKGRDAESTRRLALSLAISGEREPALRLLEDQLLVRDRAAERARALVLALTGDSAGAARAVQAAMPGPQAGAMSPFLARLPSLSPAERAMAVHLGVFPRDGRTAAPSTYAANNFANAVTDAGRPDPGQGSLARRALPPEPVSTAPRRRPGSEDGLAPAIRRTTTFRPVARSGAEETLAGVRKNDTPRRPTASSGSGGGNRRMALARGYEPSPRRKPEKRPEPARTAPAPTPAPAETTIAAVSTPFPGGQPQAAPPVRVPTETNLAAAVRAAPPSALARDPAATPGLEASSISPFQLQPGPPSQPAEVRIAAVEPSPPPPQPQPEPQAQPAEVEIAALQPSAPPPQAEAVPTGSRLADLSATIADIAEPEPAPARTASPKAKPAAAAPVKKPKAAPAEPSRVWVQIAGGAAKVALPREFARLRAKAPKVFGARGAWTAPLNATNRLLVGPFASSKEAQTFVNQLKAEDLSGFTWTSAAGQKVEKLPAK
ncbi:MAG: SPOR domain-containing protein [Allosphingosinicella sp.]